MTLKQAKKLTLEVWRYIADHPEIKRKYHLPPRLLKKADKFVNKCPVCEYIVNVRNHKSSLPSYEGCPLLDNKNGCYLYTKWYWAVSKKARQKYAQKIVDAIEAWEEL